MAETVSQFLREARELISTPDRWVKKDWAHDTNGAPIGATSPDACRWCADGALLRVCGGVAAGGKWTLRKYLTKALPVGGGFKGFYEFNDDPSTTHADVLALFDRAIALAESEEGAVAK